MIIAGGTEKYTQKCRKKRNELIRDLIGEGLKGRTVRCTVGRARVVCRQ